MKKVVLILFLFGFICQGSSQVCTGTLGFPTIRRTFEIGNNPGAPLFNKTPYTYTTDSCPGMGQYTLRNYTVNCFNTWQNLPEDHTPGDNNGFFVLVNAAANTGDFYIDTVKGLCEATYYRLDMWVMNMVKSFSCALQILPNLSIRIETTAGLVLGTYNSGDIFPSPSPQWVQFGLNFSLPIGERSVVLRITDNSKGGCGNVIAFDDITFSPCTANVNAFIVQNGFSFGDECAGDTQQYIFTTNIQGTYIDPGYHWEISSDKGRTWLGILGSDSTSYVRPMTDTGTFEYRLVVSEIVNEGRPTCGVTSNTITIRVNPLPDPTIKSNSPVCEGQDIILSGLTGALYTWRGPGNFSGFKPTEDIAKASPAQAGTYYLTVTSDKGCIDSSSTAVVINPSPVAEAGTDTTVCEGVPVAMHASGGVQFSWSPAAGLSSANIANPVARPPSSTHYVVTVFNAVGCSDTASVILSILNKPVANAGPDKKVAEGNSVMLQGAESGTDVSWYWSPASDLNDATKLQPVSSPSTDIIYTLHVSSNVGCGSSEDEVAVKIIKEIKIPNAFSPNGDGINDSWYIEALDAYSSADVQVYNRYGQLVFHGRGNEKRWDGSLHGKPLPVGTYYYVIDLKDSSPARTGSVSIIR